MPTLAGSTRPAKSFAPSQQGVNTKAPTTLCGGSLLISGQSWTRTT